MLRDAARRRVLPLRLEKRDEDLRQIEEVLCENYDYCERLPELEKEPIGGGRISRKEKILKDWKVHEWPSSLRRRLAELYKWDLLYYPETRKLLLK